MITQSNITLGQRLKAPTPKFFKTLQTISLVVGSASAVLAFSPVGSVLKVVAAALAAAATATGATASTAVDFDALKEQQQ
jgi:hypothetical protein